MNVKCGKPARGETLMSRLCHCSTFSLPSVARKSMNNLEAWIREIETPTGRFENWWGVGVYESFLAQTKMGYEILDGLPFRKSQ